jgi:hypothetical protein
MGTGSARDLCLSLVAGRWSHWKQERFGLAAESLLFEWPKRSNQEKGHPASAPAAHPARPVPCGAHEAQAAAQLARPCARTCSLSPALRSAPRRSRGAPFFLRPGFLPGLQGEISVRCARPGSRAKYWQQSNCFWLLASGFWLLASGFWLLASGFWLLASGFWLLASGFWLLASGFWLLAVAVALAPLLYPARKSYGTSQLENQAGCRVEGTWGPSGAPRSGAGSRGKRACPSTGMCELRSGLEPASTAGDPVCTTHTGRGRGVAFSWLLLFDHSKRSDSAARPKRLCF